jgi:hypothetical protein
MRWVGNTAGICSRVFSFANFCHRRALTLLLAFVLFAHLSGLIVIVSFQILSKRGLIQSLLQGAGVFLHTAGHGKLVEGVFQYFEE